MTDDIGILLDKLNECLQLSGNGSDLKAGLTAVGSGLAEAWASCSRLESRNEALVDLCRAKDQELLEARKASAEAAERHREELKDLGSRLALLTDHLTCEVRERKHIESYTQISNALLKLLNESASRKEYLDAVVRRFCDWSGCRCIGIRVLHESGAMPYDAYVGFSREFWEQENELLLGRDNCICPRMLSGAPGPQDSVCLTDGGSFCCNDTLEFLAGLTTEQRSLYRGVCITYGFRSLAVVPVSYEGRIMGVVHMADPESGKASPTLIGMVESLAPLIGEAISKFNIKDRLEREKELQRLGALELERRRDELAHIGRVVTIGEIASSLAHELNQPLAGILANAQAAGRFLGQSEPDLEEVHLAIDDIIADSVRASSVIKRLRSMLKKMHSAKTVCDVREIIHGTMMLVANNARQRKISIESNTSPDLPKILGDAIQLQQVLLNLILNACDAVAANDPGCRRITISAFARDDGSVEVAVSDNGVGVDADQLTQIFESFYTTKPEGIGMGLP
ncbi:MAG: hypothetical protein LLG06_07995, partial [Desulfobacteraceae bacterium]|nr:hypothetical protein [Desulfobacteraceae bacterium]